MPEVLIANPIRHLRFESAFRLAWNVQFTCRYEGTSLFELDPTGNRGRNTSDLNRQGETVTGSASEDGVKQASALGQFCTAGPTPCACIDERTW
jgi:hypothetical protein